LLKRSKESFLLMSILKVQHPVGWDSEIDQRDYLPYFTENGSILDIVSKTGVDGLDIVQSSPWLIGADRALARGLLKRLLEGLKEQPWGYVLIDCSPTLGIVSLNALKAAHKVLVPLELHIMGMQGLAQLMNTITAVKDSLNPALEIDGILACRTNKRARLAQDILANLRKRFSGQVYETTIRGSVKLAEAPSFGKPITTYDTKSSGAEDYRSLAMEIIKRRISEVNMAKRQTIGENPLDGLFEPAVSSNGNSVSVLNGEGVSPQQKPKSSRKQRITVQISVDVIERLKNAVYWTPGLTLASLAEEAFAKAVDQLEEKKEVPFPKRKEELKTGFPIN